MNLGSTLTNWEAGEQCEKHELAFCGTCREQANIVRHQGRLQYDNDCAVASFAEITGATYPEALAAMQATGFRPAKGTPGPGVIKAFETAGYTVTRQAGMSQQAAQAASRTGRVFLIVGKDRRGGHAWTAVDGQLHRPLGPGARYAVAEITA